MFLKENGKKGLNIREKGHPEKDLEDFFGASV